MNKELEWSDPQPPTATVKYCHSVADDFRIECHGDTRRLFFYDALIRVSESLEDLQACASTIAKNVAATEHDAMRYRFLRDRDAFGEDSAPGLPTWDDITDMDMAEFDAAVDARMASSPYQPAACADQEYDHRTDLQAWFGLSYASFVVMPRVAMQLMPQEWQEKMAVLLHQYDDTINTDAFNVAGCRVQVLDKNGKLMKTPEDLLNYRHPSPEAKAELLK